MSWVSLHCQDLARSLILDEKGGKSPEGGTPRSVAHRLRSVGSKLQDSQVSLPTCVWEDSPGTNKRSTESLTPPPRVKLKKSGRIWFKLVVQLLGGEIFCDDPRNPQDLANMNYIELSLTKQG